MAEITLKATTGRPTGSRPAKRLRAEGKVPAVVYGHGEDPVAVSVDWKPLREVLTTEAGLNALIDLEVDGSTQLCIVKDLQRHPIRQTVLHVDFIRISADEAITVDVPVLLTGEALAVERENGMVDHLLFTLSVSAKPADIPNELTVDISHLEVGDAIHVSDLALPSGVTTEVDPEETVAIATVTRASIEDEGAEGEGRAEGDAGGEDAEGGDNAEGSGEG
ncbi:MAG: rplY [Acidimicrobiales bacterium]|nr:rplY [Acidimicrobiales bacterium]